jgi:hypothetical protein
LLQFEEIPGEILGSSPVDSLSELNRVINRAFTKIGMLIEGYKNIIGYRKGGGEADAAAIDQVKHTGYAPLKDPLNINSMTVGGPDPNLNNTILWMDSEFDDKAGNLNSVGGLGPESETARQDELIHASASVHVDRMRRIVMKFVKNIIQIHAFYLWRDKFNDIPVQQTVDGTGIYIPVTLTPEWREGDFLEYNFDVNPYSLTEETPEQKAQKYIWFWNSFVLPNAQFLMQSGYMPNVVDAGKDILDWINIPFDRIFRPMDPNAEKQQKPGEVPPPQQGATRTYERVSRPGHTKAGNRQAMMAAFSGANPQSAGAARFRSAG